MHWSWRPAPEVVDGFDQRVHHPTPEEQRDNGDENKKQDESDVIVLCHASGSGFCQENATDAAKGNRVGVAASKGDIRLTLVRDLHRRWMKEKGYRDEHEALAPEYEIAKAVIRARVRAGLTQEQLAKRMNTTQSVVARLDGGRARPSTQTLERLAAATGTRMKITFQPLSR